MYYTINYNHIYYTEFLKGTISHYQLEKNVFRGNRKYKNFLSRTKISAPFNKETVNPKCLWLESYIKLNFFGARLESVQNMLFHDDFFDAMRFIPKDEFLLVFSSSADIEKKKQFFRKKYSFFQFFFQGYFFSLSNFLSLVFNKSFIRFLIIAQTTETLSAGNYEHHDNFCFHVKKFMCDISWSHFATHNLIDYMSFSNAGSSGENYVMVQWILIIK